MSTNFPTSIDSLNNPQPTDNTILVPHATQHANENDAIEAIETKLGVDNSAVTSSIDYKLKNASSVNPGHKHTLAGALTDVEITNPQEGNGLLYDSASGKFKNAPAAVSDASTTVKGVSKITPAPASATEPISIGSNFATTSGTALDNSSNKIVDAGDVAENTNSKIVRRKSDGNVTVPETPSASTDGASKGFVEGYAPTKKTGVSSRAGNTASGSQTIAHGLGRTPKVVRITAIYGEPSAGAGTFTFSQSFGVYDGTNTSCIYDFATYSTSANGTYNTSTSNIIYIGSYGSSGSTSAFQSATISVDSTNITLSWTYTQNSGGTLTSNNVRIMWEVE